MGACSQWTYRNVTSRVFQKLRSVGKQQGFSIPNTTTGVFTIKAAGMKVGFQYALNQANATLVLQCVNKPVLLGCPTIKGIADQIIRESGGIAV